jgi:Transposase IS200 like
VADHLSAISGFYIGHGGANVNTQFRDLGTRSGRSGTTPDLDLRREWALLSCLRFHQWSWRVCLAAELFVFVPFSYCMVISEEIQDGMARPARVAVPGYLYHITHRGNRRARTFIEKWDRDCCRTWLQRYKERYGMRLWACCLMGSHVHLVAEPMPEDSLSPAVGHAHGKYGKEYGEAGVRQGIHGSDPWIPCVAPALGRNGWRPWLRLEKLPNGWPD